MPRWGKPVSTVSSTLAPPGTRYLLMVTAAFALQWGWQTCGLYAPTMGLLGPFSWYVQNALGCAVYLALVFAAPRLQMLVSSVIMRCAGAFLLAASSIFQIALTLGATESSVLAWTGAICTVLGSAFLTVVRFDLFVGVRDSQQRSVVLLAATALQMLIALVIRSVPEAIAMASMVLIPLAIALIIRDAYACRAMLRIEATQHVERPTVPPTQMLTFFLLAAALNSIRFVVDSLEGTASLASSVVIGSVFILSAIILVAVLASNADWTDVIVSISVAVFMVIAGVFVLSGGAIAPYAVVFSSSGYYLFGVLFWSVTVYYAVDCPQHSVYVAAFTHAVFTLGLFFGGVLSHVAAPSIVTSQWLLAITNVAMIAAFVLVIKDLKLGVHRREREQLATLPGLRQTIEADCLILATGKGLTKRELETACDLSMGMSVKTIAEMRGVSENTVKTHAAHAYRKLDVHSREELMDLVRDVDEARISGGLMDGVSAGS